MLNGIPYVLSPDLFKYMMEMWHGDEIVFTDSNFPIHTLGQRVVRADGTDMKELLRAVLKFFPLDTYAQPVYLMEKVKGDNVETPIWEDYKEIIKPYTNAEIEHMERFEFYERAKKAYAIVMTGEMAQYSNIILKKGCVLKSNED